MKSLVNEALTGVLFSRGFLFILCLTIVTRAKTFSISNHLTCHPYHQLLLHAYEIRSHERIGRLSLPSTKSDQESLSALELPPQLLSLVESFRDVVDNKLRYQQLLFLAAKSVPIPDELKVEQNKVSGCLSTVFIHATIDSDDKVYFQGDSDAMLTKGLVVMLVSGLSGLGAQEISRIDPSFISHTNLQNSLTPSRNNGFRNMFEMMRRKAMDLYNQKHNRRTIEAPVPIPKESSQATDISNGKPLYSAIVKKLSMLQPVELRVTDESANHASHKHMISNPSSNGETHFDVYIVSKAFEGLSLVQRHRMIYTLLSAEMTAGIHALSIHAFLPAEAEGKNNIK